MGNKKEVERALAAGCKAMKGALSRDPSLDKRGARRVAAGGGTPAGFTVEEAAALRGAEAAKGDLWLLYGGLCTALSRAGAVTAAARAGVPVEEWYEDMRQEAVAAMLYAAELYDGSTAFTTYLTVAVRRAVYDASLRVTPVGEWSRERGRKEEEARRAEAANAVAGGRAVSDRPYAVEYLDQAETRLTNPSKIVEMIEEVGSWAAGALGVGETAFPAETTVVVRRLAKHKERRS